MWIFVIPVVIFASLTFAGGIASTTDKQPDQPHPQTSPAPPTSNAKR
jgi:hypothetical protein